MRQFPRKSRQAVRLGRAHFVCRWDSNKEKIADNKRQADKPVTNVQNPVRHEPPEAY